MQSQLVCRGCKTTLLYPRGAANVCCAVCNVVTTVPPGMDMSQLICGGCHTLLMYTRGATSVRCSCCHTVSLVPALNHQVAHINCGNCSTTLMYPYGSQSVRCAICQYVTNINMGNTSIPVPASRPDGIASSGTTIATSTGQTVIVQNPVSVDETGKTVNNVVVGVTT